MATLASISNLQQSIALAERQVQRDQSQIQEDSAQLNQSQAQLDKDQRNLNHVQDQGQSVASQALGAVVPTLSKAIDQPAALPASVAAPAAPRPQVNTQGQTIGTRINVTA